MTATAMAMPTELDLTAILGQKNELISQAGRVVVTNDEQEKLAGDLMKMVKNVIKAADTERLSGTLWFRTKVDEINARYNTEVINPLKDALAKIEKAMKPYALDKIKKQREEERLARVALENKALEQAAAADTPEEAEQVMTTAVKAADRIEQSTTVRGTYGSVTSKRIKFKYEVNDHVVVPREYIAEIKLDKKKLDQLMESQVEKHGGLIPNIPGITITEDVQFSSR